MVRTCFEIVRKWLEIIVDAKTHLQRDEIWHKHNILTWACSLVISGCCCFFSTISFWRLIIICFCLFIIICFCLNIIICFSIIIAFSVIISFFWTAISSPSLEKSNPIISASFFSSSSSLGERLKTIQMVKMWNLLDGEWNFLHPRLVKGKTNKCYIVLPLHLHTTL